jgi:hypothetical protein
VTDSRHSPPGQPGGEGAAHAARILTRPVYALASRLHADHPDVTYLTSLRSGIGDDAAGAIAGMEHSAMRDWKKPADGTFVMWTVIVLFVLGLLSIVSGVTPVVDPGPWSSPDRCLRLRARKKPATRGAGSASRC